MDSILYFSLAKQDFFTRYILSLVFLPYLFAFLLLGVVFYYISTDFYHYLFTLLQIDFNFSSAWLTWIQGVLDYFIKVSIVVFLCFLFIGMSLLVSYAICAFLAPYIVRFIQSRHYTQLQIEGNYGIFATFFSILKAYCIFIIFLFLLLPLYFIPFIGGFILLLPSYWLFSNRLIADTRDEIFKKEALKEITIQNKSKIRKITLPLFGLSLVPFLGFFVPIFAICVATHLFFNIKKDSYGNAITN